MGGAVEAADVGETPGPDVGEARVDLPSFSFSPASPTINGSSSFPGLIPFDSGEVDNGSVFGTCGGGGGTMSGPGVGRIFLLLNLRLSEHSIHLSMSVTSPPSSSSSPFPFFPSSPCIGLPSSFNSSRL